jgi:hypothetical protein
VAEDFVFCAIEETDEVRQETGIDDGSFVERVD